jgi:hypothetical protein
MSQTVVGVFRDIADAQLARNLLLADGFPADDIKIDVQPDAIGTASAEDGGLMRGIEKLLGNLFGMEEESGPHSAKVTAGTGAALKVVVEDEWLSDTVRNALAEVGAANVGSRGGAGLRPARRVGLTGAFVRHYQAHYAATGASYSNYEPAYRYGASLVWETEDLDCDWSVIEERARRGWQDKRRGSNWSHFMPAVRYGWSEAKRHSAPAKP